MLIIPTYNERDNVWNLVARIRSTVPDEPMLFVDDNSPDGTAEAIRQLQNEFAGIHLVVRQDKRGYGSACRDAIRMILRDGMAPHVIQFDADLSHPPELLPTMIRLLREWPAVIGSRYVKGGGSKNWEIGRKILSRGANFYARILTGVPVRDMTAGFVGYQLGALAKLDLDQIRSEGYAFLMEMKFHLQRTGAAFREFPIVFVERESGKSKFSRRIMWEGVRYPWRALGQRILYRNSTARAIFTAGISRN